MVLEAAELRHMAAPNQREPRERWVLCTRDSIWFNHHHTVFTVFDHCQGLFGLVFGLFVLFYICITHILFSIFQKAIIFG